MFLGRHLFAGRGVGTQVGRREEGHHCIGYQSWPMTLHRRSPLLASVDATAKVLGRCFHDDGSRTVVAASLRFQKWPLRRRIYSGTRLGSMCLCLPPQIHSPSSSSLICILLPTQSSRLRVRHQHVQLPMRCRLFSWSLHERCRRECAMTSIDGGISETLLLEVRPKSRCSKRTGRVLFALLTSPDDS